VSVLAASGLVESRWFQLLGVFVAFNTSTLMRTPSGARASSGTDGSTGFENAREPNQTTALMIARIRTTRMIRP